jgi:hypothetical protein
MFTEPLPSNGHMCHNVIEHALVVGSSILIRSPIVSLSSAILVFVTNAYVDDILDTYISVLLIAACWLS